VFGGNRIVDNYQNYFIHNGKKYYTGTVFKMKSFEDCTKIVEATFICYNPDNGYYRYMCNKKGVFAATEVFNKLFIEPTDKIDSTAHMPTTKSRNDMEINGLFIGWMWYIIIMAIAIIFKDMIPIWIITSICFFNFRNKKIKKEGFYREW
jgi:hypothetical protein